MGVFHSFQSEIGDESDDSLVRPSDWNAEHAVGLFELDSLGDMMPTDLNSADFELDGNGDVQPVVAVTITFDAVYELDVNADIMPKA
jgi:hypothetical protein